MKKLHAILLCSVTLAAIAALPATSGAQQPAQESKPATPKAAQPPSAPQEAKFGKQYSGMYSFLEDGGSCRSRSRTKDE
jgi:hypothetical protein